MRRLLQLLRRYDFWGRGSYRHPRSRRQDYIALFVIVATSLAAAVLLIMIYIAIRHVIR